MSDANRILWSEGLFLRPQHFQQQERYFEAFVEGRAGALRNHAWGFTQLELERDLLAIGKLAVRRARGVFPDGTPFSIPDQDAVPAPLEITNQIRDQTISLAIPVRKAGATLADRGGGAGGLTRFRVLDFETRDVASDSGAAAELEVASLQTRLLTPNEPEADFVRIPLAHVVECRADKQVVLDERFVPTVMSCAAALPLATFLQELHGLLRQRAEALAARAVATGRGGAAEIAEFLILQIVNRYEPLVGHFAGAARLHPEDLYCLALQIAGELATLTMPARRPPQFPAYRHEALRASMEPVIAAVRACLGTVIDPNAIKIPLVQKKFGISVATVNDKALFDTAQFVLAARADVPSEDFRRGFPAQLKIGSVEKIRDIVMLQVSGIGLVPMAVAPRQIPYLAGYFYFELDRSSDLWRSLKTSGGIAVHLSGEFPGLAMELWAIRS